jgi:GTP cyclohydrolase I
VSDIYPLNHPNGDGDWKQYMSAAVAQMLNTGAIGNAVSGEHVIHTPRRVVEMYEELFSGCFQSPSDALNTLFPSDSDEMIHVKEITFFSTCQHHLLPFYGRAFFAYIPNGKIVGLSKIPRLIDVYARRPQVQEELTSQIVDAFQRIVEPRGCALMMRAYHFCCMSRGVKQPTSYTETTALRGNFKEAAVKAEFLQSVASGWSI